MLRAAACFRTASALALCLAATAPAHSAPPAARTPPAMQRSQCSSPSPAYPADPGGQELSGTVRLKYLVDDAGKVGDMHVENTSGSPLLDAAAMAWVSTCRFKPATANGAPTAAWTSQNIAFHRTRRCETLYPEYPVQSRRAGESGTVTIRYQVDASGVPVHIGVAESSGHALLDNAVTDWFSKCRYEPDDFKDAPREAWLMQKYSFRFKE